MTGPQPGSGFHCPVGSILGATVRAILGVASCSALGLPALAQQGEALEEIIVTGYRQSLEAALEQKRTAVGAIDAILAEDIADFPDANLAESIQRIPGVAITRDAGEGRQISVRGLGAQFTRIRINGMEALTTGGGTDATGGTNRDRSFDFNIFASELFNQITVRKTAAAEVEEGSLGATVDLHVARPFDYDGFTVVTSGQMGFNDLNSEWNPRAALLLSNTFAGDTFGALVSVAYTDRKIRDEGASTVRWQNGGTFNSVPAGFDPAEVANAFRPRIPRYDIYEHDQERLGLTASLQWRATDVTLFTFDAMYARFDATRSEIFLQSPNFSASLSEVDVLDAEIVDHGVNSRGQNVSTLTYGVFNNVDIRAEQRYDELETEFTQFTLDGTHSITDSFRVHGLVGVAKSRHDNPIQTTLLWDAMDIQGYVYDFRGNSRTPLISYGDADVANPNTWTLSQVRLRPQAADNEFDNYLLDVAWDVSDGVTVKAGVQHKKYQFVTSDRRRSNGSPANIEAVVPDFAASTSTSSYSRTVSLGNDLDYPSGTTTVWVVPDLHAAAQLWNLYDESVFPLGIEPALGGNFGVTEKDTGGFLQADFVTQLAGRTLRGNVGVRYVETEQRSTGWTRGAGGTVLTTTERTYSDTLPSLNLALEVTDDFIVRFGAAKVMARPGLGNLNPGANVTVSGNNKVVNSGNPRLDPFRADAYDLSFEWYFAPESLVSLAVFYKDVGTFVQTIRETGPFAANPLGLPDSLALTACGVEAGDSTAAAECLADWQFNIPSNTPGGDLKGFEVGYQQPFSFLPGIWRDFGALINYTYVESKIRYLNSDGTVAAETDLTGLSQDAFNATLYYDNNVFSARVSAAYRDRYLTTVPGRNGNDVEGTASTLTVDAAASWKLNDSLTLTLEALNLTDEFQDQWVDSVGDRLSYYHHTGRQYFVGARYRF